MAAISGEVGEVVARVVEPIKASEEYYSDMLRLYLGVVARVLQHAGCWPPSLPFLIDCCQLRRFPRIRELCSDDEELLAAWPRRAMDLRPTEGRKAVAGGAVRLQVVMGEAWRPVLAPRITPSANTSPSAWRARSSERAVVLWRTYVDDMPKEAAMITVLALADMYAAAADRRRAVDAAARRVRRRNAHRGHPRARDAPTRPLHHGQVIVVTHSAADPEALTGQPGLLAS